MMTETAIGKSHLPQLLDHAHPLFEAETAREGGGEAVQIRCVARSRIGELEQAHDFVVGERKPARQRIDHRLAELAQERQTLEQRLTEPLAPADIADCGRRLKAASDETATLEERWLELSTELDGASA